MCIRDSTHAYHKPGGRLPLLSVRPAVTFPAVRHHRPQASTKLYCLVTEAHRCEKLAQTFYAVVPGRDSNPQPLDRESDTVPQHHDATHLFIGELYIGRHVLLQVRSTLVQRLMHGVLEWYSLLSLLAHCRLMDTISRCEYLTLDDVNWLVMQRCIFILQCSTIL